MRAIVKFRTYLNVVWGKPINGRKAFAFVNGFPGTFFLTGRRAIVVAEFTEKKGWLQKKRYHRLVFEAGLHKIKEYSFNFILRKKGFTGFISFDGHNELTDEAMIQFIKIPPEIKKAIEDHIKDLNVKNPVENSGIVKIDLEAPPPQRWLNERYGKKA